MEKALGGPKEEPRNVAGIEEGRSSERTLLVLGLRLSRTLGLDSFLVQSLKEVQALQGSTVLGTGCL